MSEERPEEGIGAMDAAGSADLADTPGVRDAAGRAPAVDAVDALERIDEGPEDGGDGYDAPGDSQAVSAADEEQAEVLAIPLAELRPALEAVLMVSDQPIDHLTLASAVGYPPGEVAAALVSLAEEYAEQGRGFDLRNVAGGWRFYTREEFAGVVEKFVLDGQQARLTQAALETLAVVAYKQPVSRARVSAIRGVNVDGVMRTLVSRGLVEEAGHDGETTAMLYRTTSYFLERIGVTDLGELPELAPLLPDMVDLDDPDERVADPVPAPGGGPDGGDPS